MKAIWTAVTVLLFFNVVVVAGHLHAAGAHWSSYVGLFSSVLFGHFVCRLIYWDDEQ